MQPFHASSLRSRLLLLILVAVIPAAVLLVRSAVDHREREATTVQETALRMARVIADDRARTLHEGQLLLQSLAGLPAVRDGDTEACQAMLGAALQGNRRYRNLGVLGADGSILCTGRTLPANTLPSAVTLSTVREALRTGRFAQSGFNIGQVSRRPIEILAYPIASVPGRPARVVYASLDLEWVNRLAARVRLTHQSAVMVVDANGKVLVRHPDPHRWVGRSVLGVPQLQRVLRATRDTTFTAPGVDRVPRLFAAAPLRDANGSVHGFAAVSVPVSVAFEVANRALYRSLGLLGAISLLTLALAWVGGSLLVLRPVHALLRATRRLQAGDREARSEVPHAVGELVELGRAFDEMAEALQRRHDEAERTAQVLRRQALLFDTLTEGVLVTDAQGVITDWNQGAQRIFGYTRDEMLGQTTLRFHHPDLGDSLVREITASLEQHGRWAGEVPFRRKDGTDGVSEAVVVAQYDEQGRRVAHIGVNRDVTDRKKAEEALRESRDLLNAVIESASDSIFVRDREGRYVMINNAGAAVFGRTPGELVGVGNAELVAPEVAQRAAADDRRVLEEGACVTSEVAVAGAQGTRTFSTVKVPWRDEAGNILGIIGVGRDLTPRLEAERVVRESEASYRSLFNSIAEMVYILDMEGRLVAVNEAVVAACGYTHEEVVGQRPELLSCPERTDAAALVRYFGRAVAGERVQFEMWGRRKDGSCFPKELTLSRTTYFGRPAVIAVARDITERKRAEQALRESQRALSTLMDNLPGMAYRCANDARWSAELVSQGCVALTGYTPAELMSGGRVSIGDLIHSDDRERVWGEVQQALDARQPFQLTYRLVTRTGEQKWVWEQGQGVYAESGELCALEGMILDVTARTQAEEALRESEEFSRSVLASSNDSIRVLDLQGCALPTRDRGIHLPDGDDLAVPSGACWVDLWPDEVREAAREAVGAAAGGGVGRFRGFRPAPGGAPQWWDVCITPILGADGQPEHLLSVARDVTEHRQLEEQLRQAQKMEAVGRLAGGVAHDFNNLLTAIRGNVEMALLDLPAHGPLREGMEQVQQAAETAASLTRQLLTFSRKQAHEAQVLDLNRIIELNARLIQRLLGPDVELETSLQPELGSIRADQGQMEQVLINLAVNARDAMPQGGVLVVLTADVELHEEHPLRAPGMAPGRYVQLTVSDTGVGMDEETRARIFEPFFTTKALGKGTGLGLFTVYGIVQQNGGRVWAESVTGSGTRIHILLPHTPRAEEATASLPATLSLAGGGETILLVDDEMPVRVMAQRLLRRIGYRVIEATDGEEALALAASHSGSIDLLLTDLTMPRMGGRELAARFTDLHPGTPVVFMSGYADGGALPTSLHGAVTAFVAKPFTIQVLASTVRATLDTRPTHTRPGTA